MGRDATLARSVDMPAILLFTNVPFDCSDDLLNQWIEDRVYPVLSIQLIRDVVTGTHPRFAHVELVDTAKLHEAEQTLDGQTFMGRRLRVRRLVTGWARPRSA